MKIKSLPFGTWSRVGTQAIVAALVLTAVPARVALAQPAPNASPAPTPALSEAPPPPPPPSPAPPGKRVALEHVTVSRDQLTAANGDKDPPPAVLTPAPVAPRVVNDGAKIAPGYQKYLPPAQVAPRVLKWNEGAAIPPGYHKATEKRAELVISGSIIFGTAWLPTAAMGMVLGWYHVAIPVAGPFMGPMSWEGERPGLLAFLWVFDGIQQAAGLAMLIAGLSAPRTILIRSEVKAAKTWWLPTPMSFGKESAGLGILGRM